MEPAERERLLHVWGYDFGEPRPREWDEVSSLGASALAGALDSLQRRGIAPIKREPFGEVRRTVGGKTIVTERRLTAKGRQSIGGGRIWRPRREAASIERAWTILYLTDHKEYATILRVHYCRRGNQKEKAAYAAEILGMPRMPGLRYRRGLRDGREKLFAIFLTRVRKTG